MAEQGGQSQRVYTAQDDAFGIPLRPEITLDEAQALADRVLTDEQVIAQFGRQTLAAPVSFGFPPFPAMASTTKSRRTGELTITIAPFCATRAILLHELAHVLIQEPDGDEHNAAWAACYLVLLRRFDTAKHADTLEKKFRQYDVRYDTDNGEASHAQEAAA